MKDPKTFTKKFDRELARDLGFLFIASCFVLVQLFDYSLFDAALISPILVTALVMVLYLFVQILWFMLLVLDKICSLLHLKGSSIS